MSDPVQVIKRDGYTISIYYDEYPENPRQCNDYLCEIICWHDKYDLGDRTVRRGEMAEVLNTYRSDKYFNRPVHLYDHGGITMSLESFGCPWDSGQVGFIACDKKKAMEVFPELSHDKLQDHILRRVMVAEVEEYDQYLRGDIYCFVIRKDDDEDIEESCFGIYGEENCIQEANRTLDDMIEHRALKVAEGMLSIKNLGRTMKV